MFGYVIHRLLVMIPMFVLSFTIRKYFIEGLTLGAVK